MSLYDYRTSMLLSAEDYPFHALLMAAMRKADTDNLQRLTEAFPEVWGELYARYHAPGGVMAAEQEDDTHNDTT